MGTVYTGYVFFSLESCCLDWNYTILRYGHMQHRRGKSLIKDWATNGFGQKFQDMAEEVLGRGRILASITYHWEVTQCARPDPMTPWVYVPTSIMLIQPRSHQASSRYTSSPTSTAQCCIEENHAFPFRADHDYSPMARTVWTRQRQPINHTLPSLSVEHRKVPCGISSGTED